MKPESKLSEVVLSRFEEGKPADPTENMNEEDAKKWEEMNKEHRDNFKSARATDKAQRVLARFKLASDEGEKFIGENVRLSWGAWGRNTQWLLEELPQKGKKKLRVGTLENPVHRFSGVPNMSAYIPENVLQDAKLTGSDDYDAIKRKLLVAYEKAAAMTLEGMSPETLAHGRGWTWLKEIKWYENEVHYLKVAPEGTEPFVAEGKDFNVKVSWTNFKSYSPSSDFQQMDPHYTLYESSSATAARKCYLMLKADPSALKSMPWDKFDDWLKKNKIGYEVHFSVWH